MPFSSGFVTERTAVRRSPREKTAPGSRTARFSRTGRAFRSVYESSTRSTDGRLPLRGRGQLGLPLEEARDGRLRGARPAPTGTQADQVASGFSAFPDRTNSATRGARGHAPPRRAAAPNVDRRSRVLHGGGERAGRRTPAGEGRRIPGEPIRHDGEARAAAARSRAQLLARLRHEPHAGGPSRRRPGHAGRSRREARRRRVEAQRVKRPPPGTATPGSTKPSAAIDDDLGAARRNAARRGSRQATSKRPTDTEPRGVSSAAPRRRRRRGRRPERPARPGPARPAEASTLRGRRRRATPSSVDARGRRPRGGRSRAAYARLPCRGTRREDRGRMCPRTRCRPDPRRASGRGRPRSRGRARARPPASCGRRGPCFRSRRRAFRPVANASAQIAASFGSPMTVPALRGIRRLRVDPVDLPVRRRRADDETVRRHRDRREVRLGRQ